MFSLPPAPHLHTSNLSSSLLGGASKQCLVASSASCCCMIAPKQPAPASISSAALSCAQGHGNVLGLPQSQASTWLLWPLVSLASISPPKGLQLSALIHQEYAAALTPSR